jgi:hypothetical protein
LDLDEVAENREAIVVGLLPVNVDKASIGGHFHEWDLGWW